MPRLDHPASMVNELRADEVYTAPVRDRWLVYSPLRRVAGIVDDDGHDALVDGWPAPPDGPLADLRRLLSSPASPRPQVKQGPVQPAFLGIIPTRSCNLACRYCAFGASGAGSKCMDVELARSLVDWIVDESAAAGRNKAEVHFFGGEPFIAPRVVEAVVDQLRVRTAGRAVSPSLHAATNGYMSEDFCRFVGENFDVVVVSLDGTAELQNRLRPLRGGRPSFEVVSRSIASLARSRSRLCLRTCVTQDSVGQLDALVAWLCETFRPSSLTVEPLQETSETRAAGIRPPDPREFARMTHRAIRVSQAYRITTVYAGARIEALQATFCPVGRDALIASPEGEIAACYLMESEWRASGLDLSLGSFDSGRMQIDTAAIDRARSLASGRPECVSCFCRWHCAGGCHVRMHPSRPAAERWDYCLQTRALTAAALLDAVGRPELADALLEDDSALDRLAASSPDRLADKRCPC